MPYIKNLDPTEDVEIFYEVYRAGSALPRPVVDRFTTCSRPQDEVYDPREELDRSRETIVFIHPPAMDGTAFFEQIRCDDLRLNYNILTIDTRYCGRTHGRYRAGYDACCAVVEVLFVLNYLEIKRFHMFAAGIWGCGLGLRLNALFPEKFITLAINGYSRQIEDYSEEMAVFNYILASAAVPQDEDECLDTMDELTHHYWGTPDTIGADLYDWIGGIWTRRYGPTHGGALMMVKNFALTAPPVPKEDVRKIKNPVVVFRGTDDMAYPIEIVEEGMKDFESVSGGVKLVTVEGGGFITHQTCADQVTPAYVTFLSESRAHSTAMATATTTNPNYGPMDLDSDLQTAMAKISKQFDKPEMLKRPLRAPMSYSVYTEEKLREAEKALKGFAEEEKNPLRIRGDVGPETWDDVGFEERFVHRLSQRGVIPFNPTSESEDGTHQQTWETVMVSSEEDEVNGVDDFGGEGSGSGSGGDQLEGQGLRHGQEDGERYRDWKGEGEGEVDRGYDSVAYTVV